MSTEAAAKPGAEPVRISILIASLGRPTLLKTLDSIDAAIVPEGCEIDIVVVDDSLDRRVAPLLAGRAGRHPTRVIEVGARNVSVARNALLDAATGDWGIFVDDDEHVDARWMEGHLSAARDFEADVVFGPVYFVYPPSTPEWFKQANLMWQDLGWSDDGKPASTGATGNTLMRMATVRRLNLRFDTSFGRSGGGDWDFFSRVAAAGGRMVLSDRPRAWEDVSEARANPAYLLERSSRTGHTYARCELAGASGFKRLRFTLNALAKLAIAGTATLLAWPFSRAWRYRFQAMAWSNLGKLQAIMGAQEGDGWAEEVRPNPG